MKVEWDEERINRLEMNIDLLENANSATRRKIKDTELRLEQLECSHNYIVFERKFLCTEYPFYYGYQKCSSCGKVLKKYPDKVSYLKALLENEEKILSSNTKTQKENIEKLKEELKEK